MKHKGQPTVILAKTVKGYGMGEAGEGQNITHQQKKMGEDGAARVPRPLPDCRSPTSSSHEVPFLTLRRGQPGDGVPARSAARRSAAICRRAGASPTSLAGAAALGLRGAARRRPASREISTTMAFVRILNTLLRDKKIGKRVVPIVPDEIRTFGMEGMFRQFGIFSQVGQLYRPQDADQLMFYKEDKNGQILQEGINEAGRHVVLDRRGDVLQHQRRADDPVLHLLLDVRLPARRRSRLGGRRHARPRLPARRHRRAAPR